MASIHKKQKKDGTYVYFVVFRNIKGEQIWERAGSYEEAKIRRIETEHSLLVGTYTKYGKMTFGDLADLWLEEHVKNLNPSTSRGYKSYLDAIILPEFKNVKLSMITCEVCQSFKRSLMTKKTKKNTKLSEQSIKHVFAIMRSIFNWAISRDLMSRNPVIGIELPRVPKRSVRVLTLKETLHLIDCVDGVYREFIATAALSGMRASEISGAKCKDVDFYRRTISVVRSYDFKEGYQPPKTNSSRRTIPIVKPLYDILLPYYEKRTRKPEEPLFMGKDGKPLVYYSNAFKRALEKAGLPDMTFHDLRHSYLSILDSMGIRLTLIKDIAGHSSITVTADVYNHQTIEDLQQVRKAFDGLFSNE